MFEEPASDEQLELLVHMMFNMTVYSITLMRDTKSGHPALRHTAKQIANKINEVGEPVKKVTMEKGEVPKHMAFSIVFTLSEVREEILKLEKIGYVVEVDNFDNENVKMSDYLSAEIDQFAQTMG